MVGPDSPTTNVTGEMDKQHRPSSSEMQIDSPFIATSALYRVFTGSRVFLLLVTSYISDISLANFAIVSVTL